MLHMKIPVNVCAILIEQTRCEDPKKDVRRYLVVDKVRFVCREPMFSTKKNPEEDSGWMNLEVVDSHVEEFKVRYCDECLKRGERNEEVRYDDGSLGLCRKHLIEYSIKHSLTYHCRACNKGLLHGMSGYPWKFCDECDFTTDPFPYGISVDVSKHP